MKTWTQLPVEKINIANQRLWDTVGVNAEEVLSRLITDSRFVVKIAEVMINGGFEILPTTEQRRARNIMGKNFFGIEDAVKHFGVKPTGSQLETLAKIPFDEETLESCRDSHVLVAVFPLSIIDIRSIVNNFSQGTLFYTQDWYEGQAFARDKGEVEWQLVKKIPINNSFLKTWEEQLELLSEDEEVPTAQIITYTAVGYFFATEDFILKDIYVRTNSFDLASDRVCFGNFHNLCFGINHYWDDVGSQVLGISTMKKQNS